MAQRDLVVSFLSAVPKSVLALFKERPLQVVCPVARTKDYDPWLAQFWTGRDLIPGLARHAGAEPGDTIGRVCVVGFSNGCEGVRKVLAADDSNKIDVVLAVDGIHGGYVSGRHLYPPYYKNLMNRAAQSATADPSSDPDAPVTVYTHSSIVPDSFPSSAETCAFIWEQVYGRTYPWHGGLLPNCATCEPANVVNALAAENAKTAEYCQLGQCYSWKGFSDGLYDVRFLNSFYALGWGDLVAAPIGDWQVVRNVHVQTRDPRGYTDHQFQAKLVLPALLREFCVKRWQSSCAPVATIGFGDACTLPRGRKYSEADGPKVDYFPELKPAGPERPPSPMERVPSAPRSGLALAAAAGAAAGFAAARYVTWRH